MTNRRPVQLMGAAVLVAAVVVTAIIALLHDGGAARTAPSYAVDAASEPARTATPTDTAPTSAAPGPRSSPVARAVPTPPRTSGPATPSKKPLTYTVKRGDNLTAIARWFKFHGYGTLYERNRRVIGKDPDLIIPGQRITISATGLTTSK